MSGIAGIIHFDGAPVAPGLVESMTGAMVHRGPDGIDHWVKGSTALGQCMLRTTPESLDERQPLTNEDESLVLVMDGRVDNWEELRRELLSRDAVLRNRSDAELVFRAYETWGRDCLRHIDGDFALVIWDAQRREAFCARDRIGNKPFHYHWDGRTFAFASELHAILALPWVPETLNEGLVAEFLANEWHALDETFWQGVLRLPQAHRISVDEHGLDLNQYWVPDLHATLPCTSEGEFAEYYRALLTETVRRMSRSSGALACEASGGLDSSALLAVAEHLRREGVLLAPSLDAYTLAFTDDSAANELVYARAVGEHLGVDIREIEPTRKALAWYRERARRYRVFPSYPNGVMGAGIREAAAARGSRSLLVGVGGDEWLRGSRAYYAEVLAAHQWPTLIACLAADRRDVGLGLSLWWLVRHGGVPLLPDRVKDLLRRASGVIRRKPTGARTWLAPEMQRLLRDRRARYRRTSDMGKMKSAQRRQLDALTEPFLAHARELEEALASHSGIELRRPFFGKVLVDFALAAPEWLRLRGRTDKYLHRVSMTGYLPERVRMRETKAEFMIAFCWHLPELELVLSGDIVPARSAWVASDRVADMHTGAEDPTRLDSPEWKLWTLFGCDALAARD
jgi:asparagine synthase (glutamine-hydrolysing)